MTFRSGNGPPTRSHRFHGSAEAGALAGLRSGKVKRMRGYGPSRVFLETSRHAMVGDRRRGRLRWRRGRGALVARAVVLTLVGAMLPLLPALRPSLAPAAQAATACPDGGCAVTVTARDFATHDALPTY